MTKANPTIDAKFVATAFVVSSNVAGCSYQAIDEGRDETEDERIANLMHWGKYGPYIADGDPHDWGGPEALVTIYMEDKGTPEDCIKPLDYYSCGPSYDRVQEVLGQCGCYIEFINAAVACVYRT